jgi:hypothetical protein
VTLLVLAALVARADPAAADASDGTGSSGGQPGIGAIPADVLQVAEQVANQPLPARLTAISARLLQRPYVSDPMGEGTLPDADPFARYDAFDCLTFAEEVMALSMAGDPAHSAEIRDALRYEPGARDYVHRRHFMELQWIPDNVAQGLIRDTTKEYGATVALDKDVDLALWKAWSGRKKFAHTDDQLPMGHMHLDVLPLDEAARVASTIRPGSLILTVRVDKPGVPLWITHVSLLVEKTGGGTVLRHATLIGTVDQTRDHELAWYIDHLRTYSNWPVLGIVVLEPVEQGPRAAALSR